MVLDHPGLRPRFRVADREEPAHPSRWVLQHDRFARHVPGLKQAMDTNGVHEGDLAQIENECSAGCGDLIQHLVKVMHGGKVQLAPELDRPQRG